MEMSDQEKAIRASLLSVRQAVSCHEGMLAALFQAQAEIAAQLCRANDLKEREMNSDAEIGQLRKDKAELYSILNEMAPAAIAFTRDAMKKPR